MTKNDAMILLGFSLVEVGIGMWSVPAALIVGGIAVGFVGWLDHDRRNHEPEPEDGVES